MAVNTIGKLGLTCIVLLALARYVGLFDYRNVGALTVAGILLVVVSLGHITSDVDPDQPRSGLQNALHRLVLLLTGIGFAMDAVAYGLVASIERFQALRAGTPYPTLPQPRKIAPDGPEVGETPPLETTSTPIPGTTLVEDPYAVDETKA